MRLRHIWIAAAIVACGLVAARPWAQADRIGVFEVVMQHAHSDAGPGGNGNSDPYKQSQSADWLDPHAEGMGRPVTDLLWIQRNT